MKRNKILCYILILALTLSLFSGCGNGDDIFSGNTVKLPENIRLQNGVLKWDPVSKADEYLLNINGELKSTVSVSYADFLPNTKYEVQLRSKNIWSLSEWSEKITFQILSTPTNFVYFNGQFYWDEVEGATSYLIKIGSETYPMPNVGKYPFEFFEAGLKKASIKAVGDDEVFFDSGYSVEMDVDIEPIPWSNIKEVLPAGEGSKRFPYQLSSVQNFKWLHTQISSYANKFSGKYFVLKNDIDFRFITGFSPIGTQDSPFFANLDGKNFGLNHLIVEDGVAGVFGFLGLGATVTNLKRTGGKSLGIKTAGGIVATNFGTVMNCENSAYVQAGTAGGIVGENTDMMVVLSCKNSGEISGQNVGGIVGWNWNGSINSCINEGAINGVNTAGGISAINGGSVIASSSSGKVTGLTCGGIVGENLKSIITSSNSGEVVGAKYAGGISGTNSSTIRYSYNKGKISVTSKSNDINVGGLVGRMDDGVISNGYSVAELQTSSTQATKLPGALVGYYRSGLVNNCFYVKNDIKPIGNTEKYIGENIAVDDAYAYSQSFVDDLNSKVNKDELYIVYDKVWLKSKLDLGLPILYWQKMLYPV